MLDRVSPSPYPLRTPRLTLRMPREEDVGPLTAYRNDPQVAALQDWDLPYPLEQARALVAAHAGRTDVEPGRATQVCIEHEGRLVGDLYVGIEEPGGVAELGFTLVPSAQGRGLGLEAATAVVDDLVDRLGVHRVFAQLSKDNDASARLLERLGMSVETFAPRSYWWRGTWDDNLVYAMSDEDRRAWRDRPTGPPGEVRLVGLTEGNRGAYARLRTHRTQERFVASVLESYGDALFPGTEGGLPVVPVLRGVEADGEPAGFVMLAAAHPGTEAFLRRLLVDRRHQGRGVGRRALELLVEELKAEGHGGLVTGWVPAKGSPEPFYRAAGFVPTGDVDDGEVVARLAFVAG